MAVTFGKLCGRLYLGAMLALGGMVVLQTVRVQRPAETVTDLVPVIFNTNTPPAPAQERIHCLLPGPHAENDLVPSHFRLEEDIRDCSPTRTCAPKKRFSGDILNDSPFSYAGQFQLRFQDKDDRVVATESFFTGGLGSHKQVHLACDAPAEAVMGELLVTRITRTTTEPLLAEMVPSRWLAVALFTMLGFALHITLGGWLRPNHWERDVWNLVLK